MDYTLIVKLTNACNLNCSYCYHRRDSNRNMRHSLSLSDLDTMIRNLLQHNEREAEFIWHGGEPLLTGLDTFAFIVERQKLHNTKNLLIRNSVQTNGTLLDDKYIQFFKENNFSIGISIDGPFDMHTAERGTLPKEYQKILYAVDQLTEQNAKFGTLCVVGKQHIGNADRIFQMIQEHKIGNIGFLPCMVHTDGVVETDLTIAPEEYAQFLIDLFELWIHSNTRGISIRNFDDCIRFYRGKEPKTCICSNVCDRYLTITPEGGIFLCDNFSSSKEHQVGILENGFDHIHEAIPMQWMKQAMQSVPQGCDGCPYIKACHGGCKYYRWLVSGDMTQRQYYCGALKKFYQHVGQYFQHEVKK